MSFLSYLKESNSAGSAFEIQIAKCVKRWIKSNKLTDKFEAKRYQTVEEEETGRDEDFSDVVVIDKQSNEQFFIECKQAVKTNIVTTQFDISEDFIAYPVYGTERDLVEDNITLKLADDINNNEQFKQFISFLQTENDHLNGKPPSYYFFNKEEVTDQLLHKLMKQYNKLVDDEQVEADCKKFDLTLVRDTTRNMLACGICWRLSDLQHTWDICHIEDIPYFGQLVRQHYLHNKTIPAKYLQMNDELFVLDENDNPFNIQCTIFPTQILGKFDLKFTPRFGTGSMYITPRSKILSDIKSSSSFMTEERWPKILS